jgi:hypothetical protein
MSQIFSAIESPTAVLRGGSDNEPKMEHTNDDYPAQIFFAELVWESQYFIVFVNS